MYQKRISIIFLGQKCEFHSSDSSFYFGQKGWKWFCHPGVFSRKIMACARVLLYFFDSFLCQKLMAVQLIDIRSFLRKKGWNGTKLWRGSWKISIKRGGSICTAIATAYCNGNVLEIIVSSWWFFLVKLSFVLYFLTAFLSKNHWQ